MPNALRGRVAGDREEKGAAPIAGYRLSTDYPTLQAAVDSLPPRGGVVIVEEGLHTLTPQRQRDGDYAGLVLRDGVVLQGRGPNASIIRMPGIIGKAVRSGASAPGQVDRRIIIRDLCVAGDYLPRAEDTEADKPNTWGIYLERVSHSVVENVLVGFDREDLGGFGNGYYVGPNASGYATVRSSRFIRNHDGLILAYNAAYVYGNSIAAHGIGVDVNRLVGLRATPTGEPEEPSDSVQNVVAFNYFEGSGGGGRIGVRVGFDSVETKIIANRFDELKVYAIQNDGRKTRMRDNDVRSGRIEGDPIRTARSRDNLHGSSTFTGNARGRGMGRQLYHRQGTTSYTAAVTPTAATVPVSYRKTADFIEVWGPPGHTGGFDWAIFGI